MFNNIINSLETITSLSSNCNFDEKIREFMKTMSFSTFEKLLMMLSGQKKLKNKQYAIYKQTYKEMKYELIDYITNILDDVYPFVIDSCDESLILNAIAPFCLSEYIKQNCKQKRIFLPLNYYTGLQSTGHQAVIMFDNSRKKIYVIDPNGKPTFLNELFDTDLSSEIETMLTKYFSELKNFDLNYKYVCISEWNKNNICINRTFNNELIGSGNCVVTTLLIVQVICSLSLTAKEIFRSFEKLSDEELMFLIKTYSSGIYNTLNLETNKKIER